jgi:hypothetical protein
MSTTRGLRDRHHRQSADTLSVAPSVVRALSMLRYSQVAEAAG